MRLSVLLLLAATVSVVAQADWRSDLRDAAKQKANAKVEQSLGIANPAPAGSAVYFINIKNGDTVSAPFLVQFGLKAAGVSPAGLQNEGTGHFHILVDEPTIDFTLPLPVNAQIKHFDKGETETNLSLAPGKHTLQLLYADWKQQSFNPTVQSEKISITVK
jgi:hypothetical protein